jgi:hypothetical protein
MSGVSVLFKNRRVIEQDPGGFFHRFIFTFSRTALMGIKRKNEPLKKKTAISAGAAGKLP